MSALPDDTMPGQSTLPAYDIKKHEWQSISVSGGAFNSLDRRNDMSASSFKGGGSLSFLAGGKLPGMVIFNSSNPIRPSWENVTDGSTPYFFWGTTQYVRFGEAGVLISVGGYTGESTRYNIAMLRIMNSVQVYDIAGKKWFTIIATGELPPPRLNACSCLSAALDDSSFQMVLYGGAKGWDDSEALGDVWVLTMPAFHWIKINTTSARPTSLPRLGMLCATYQDRQMIVVGGRKTLSSNESIPSCASDYAALLMLDTTTFQWQTHYPLQDPEYKVPKQVIDIIGGNPHGNARPASSYSSTLGPYTALFSKTIPRYDPDNPPKKDFNAGPSTTQPANPRSTSSLSRAAIIGASIGGVVGAVLLGGAVWLSLLLFIRRRRERLHHIPHDAQPQWQKPELPISVIGQLQADCIYETENGELGPSEIDTARERLEAPYDTGIQRHELAGR
ncbi:MAG: hypothetical protein LQ342_007786 [Letrouitia transgressa]|nr:MAG: hypothetical protein LQ342_007786 [Letrouitia transgressa]